MIYLEKLRKDFIDFYVKKGYHQKMAHPLVLKESELLFTNSGMIQFKELFFTKHSNKYLSIQPCVRLSGKQNDLSEIGKSKYHHSSFEMIGLFQFENVNITNIIQISIEFLTKYIAPKNLIYNVHPEDKNGISALKYLNLTYRIDPTCIWSTNEKRCMEGYSIEIYYIDSENDVEIWNMVFPSWINNNGEITQTEMKLDMGAGLERLASVINKTFNNYELEEYAGAATIVQSYYPNLSKPELNKIVDHIKTSIMLQASGLRPSNKEHGYVLRKLIRITFNLIKLKEPNVSIFEKMEIELRNYYMENIIQYLRADTFMHVIDFSEEIELYLKMINSISKICNKFNITKQSISAISNELFSQIRETYGINKESIEEYINEKAE